MPTTTFFVSATGTGVGKTHTILTLMQAAADAGLRPGAFKPIETGVRDRPEDGTRLWRAMRRLNPDAAAVTLEEVVPVTYALPAAPWVARGDRPVAWERIERALHKIRAVCDFLLIEGAGGLLVPIDDTHAMIDLPRRLEAAHTLLVTTGALGAINDTRLSLEALERRGLPATVIVNPHRDDGAFETLTRPWFEAAHIPWLPLTAPDLPDRLIRRSSGPRTRCNRP
jgi:dethiobiotin synthetase